MRILNTIIFVVVSCYTLNAYSTIKSTKNISLTGKECINAISGFAVKKDGTILISDAKSHCIRFYNSTGVHIKNFGKYGLGPGEFVNPILTDYTHNTLVIVTPFLHKVFLYSIDKTNNLKHKRTVKIRALHSAELNSEGEITYSSSNTSRNSAGKLHIASSIDKSGEIFPVFTPDHFHNLNTLTRKNYMGVSVMELPAVLLMKRSGLYNCTQNNYAYYASFSAKPFIVMKTRKSNFIKKIILKSKSFKPLVIDRAFRIAYKRRRSNPNKLKSLKQKYSRSYKLVANDKFLIALFENFEQDRWQTYGEILDKEGEYIKTVKFDKLTHEDLFCTPIFFNKKTSTVYGINHYLNKENEDTYILRQYEI